MTGAPTTAEKELLASPEPPEPPSGVADGSGSGRHPALEATAGFDYGPLIVETLSEERDRKKTLEQRGLAVATTSGALVSLLFAIGAVVTSAKSFHVPGVARMLLAVGVGLFAAAAMAGIRTNRPVEYAEPGADDLLQLTDEKYWEAERGPSARRVGELRAKALLHHRRVNDRKASALTWAMRLQASATAVVAVGVVLTVVLG